MRDIYLYENSDVLKNLLDIRDRQLLNDAESDFLSFRLREIAATHLPGEYDYRHYGFYHR